MITGITEPGTQVGRYHLVERIGMGGMAEVFRARHEGVGGFTKELVIKMILPTYAHDQNFIDMFMTEAKLAAKLDHSNIVHVFDFGTEDDRHFLAMELVRGLTLRKIRVLCREQGAVIPAGVLARIACGVCAGLHYAHELRDERGEPFHIVHRDVLPENIIVTWDGEPKLLDFGIAKATTVADTVSGIVKGKHSYLAPEQVLGKKDLDRRTDVYAVGVVMYEALSGVKPFWRPGKRVFQMLEDIVEREPPPLSLFRELPQALELIVRKAMAKDPADRYRTAREMGVDIERFLAGLDEPVLGYQVARYIETLATEQPIAEATTKIPTRPDDDSARDAWQPVEVVIGAGVPEEDPEPETFEYAPEDGDEEPDPGLARVLFESGVAKMVRVMHGGRTESTRPETTSSYRSEVARALEDDLTSDDIAADLLNRMDRGVPEGEPAPLRAQRRIRTLLDRASIATNVGDNARAVIAAELALQEATGSAAAQKIFAERRAELEAVFSSFIGDHSKAPRLAIPPQQLELHGIDHRIAYLLSRIDGQISFEEILDISAMSWRETYRHLCWMLLEGILVADP